MDIVDSYKKNLLTQKKPPSSITIKNYVADIRKFLSWFVETFGIPFTPDMLTVDLIIRYKAAIQERNSHSLASASSVKRYISSLRSFCTFLEGSGAIQKNPFSLLQTQPVVTDPFFFKEFRNFLYMDHASKLTIKNYISDIKQFTDWLDQTITKHDATGDEQIRASSLIASIDNSVLKEYKLRLLNEAKLSPVSINRKLSALRRYLSWLNEKGIMTNIILEEEAEFKPAEPLVQVSKPITPVIPEPPLTALQGMAKTREKASHYSPFAPLRLTQKTTKIINLGIDLLFFNPIAHFVEAIHYNIWKNGKRAIFKPVSSIIEDSSYIPKGVTIKTIIPKATSIMPPRSARFASVLEKAKNYGYKSVNSDVVHNFPKALYAPLQISTRHMSWQQKLLYHLRYTRPEWYRKYHSFAFVHYLHIGILVVATVIAGASLYETWYSSPPNSKAVLSAEDTAPPRTLAYQGRLLDSTNTPITAETPLRFALYNSPTATGPALLWQEKQDIKPDHNGNFNAILGEKVRLKQNIFTNNPSLYIGIAVGDNKELSPRQQIPTTEYAANSDSVAGLKPITDATDIAQNVLLALDSSGNLTIGGTASHTFQATGGQFTFSGQALLLTTNPGSNGNVKIAPDGSGIIDLEKPIQNISNNIGKSGVPGAVEVDDVLSILATSSSQSALVINQNGGGEIISGKSKGIDKFSLDTLGNAFFAGSIVLNGNTINTSSTSFDIGGSNLNNLSLGTSAKVLSIGASSGITSINNNLSVQGTTTLHGALTTNGLLTANAGLTIPGGQKLTLADFAPNGIPFLNADSQVVENADNFSWNDDTHQLNVTGSLCIQNGSGVCGTTPGTIYASNTTVQSADLAENYVSSQTLQPGDVVILEGQNNTNAILKSTSPYQKELIGIISTSPGITLNSGAKSDTTHPNIYPLALQGRVPVKVSSINGPIQAGDAITSSSIPGVAMEASGSGQVIGKALESYDNTDPTHVGQIMVFVNLTYRDFPTTVANNGNMVAASDAAQLDNQTQIPTVLNFPPSLSDISNTASLAAVEAQTLTTDSLKVTTDAIMIDGQSLKNYLTTLVEDVINQYFTKHKPQNKNLVEIINRIASPSARVTQEPSPTATTSATPVPASESAGLQTSQSDTATTSAIYNSIASSSAQASPSATPAPSMVTPTASHSASKSRKNKPVALTPSVDSIESTNQYVPAASLSAQLGNASMSQGFATFDQGLISLGPSSFTDVGITGTIAINSNLKITADSINTIGSDFNIEPLRQGKVLFMGGLVAIDTQGNLQVKGDATFAHNLTVQGQLATGIIAPIPNHDLTVNLDNKSQTGNASFVIKNATGSGVLKINQSGDLASSGTAKFNNVTSNGFSIIRGAEADTSTTQTVAQGSAGTGIITMNQTERTIMTPYVTARSLIYITPTSNTGNITPYLARQTVENAATHSKGSFTVAIPASVGKNIGFNWWIVN